MEDLNPGDTITVTIHNQWNSYKFDGKKLLVLSTTTWLGGKNAFMGTAYLVTGSFACLMALSFLALQALYPRKYGDPALLLKTKQHMTAR